MHLSSIAQHDQSGSPADDAGMALPDPPSPHWRRAALAWSTLVLLIGLGVTWGVHQQQQERAQAEWTARNDTVAQSVYGELRARLENAENLLRATQSLFLASEDVSRGEFAGFYANMHPRDGLPSLVALAYAVREPSADGVRYITRWAEPEDGNDAVLGLDVGRQPRNMAGLIASRDEDQIVMSAPFRLIQTGTGPANGVTLRLPIFSGGASPLDVTERRARELGSMAISLRIDTLIAGTLPIGSEQTLRLKVVDVGALDAQPVYDSLQGQPDPPLADGYHFTRQLAYGGRTWQVSLDAIAPMPALSGWIMLAAGGLASLLLAALVLVLMSLRQRALAIGWTMTRRYRESEERFRVLNELMPALVLLAESGSGAVTWANQAARLRLGSSITHRRLGELFESPEQQAQLIGTDTRSGGQSEVRLRDELGMPFWASVALTELKLGGRSQLLMVAGDISEQRRLSERLNYQASHDPLTRLYNREEFERRMQAALDAGSMGPATLLLYIDLDQFKLINDTSGHQAGDQLLAQLALVVRQQLGKQDVLARLGGDEFGVLVYGLADRGEGELMAERVRRVIDGYVFSWDGRNYLISASIGAVLIERSGQQASVLLAQADAACYLAKEQGRNRVHFHAEQDSATRQRHGEMEWATRLQWAVDEDRLVLAYQEIRRPPLDSGAAPGIEILLRFRDESGALLLPGAFLPAAERYGLMPAIDRYVVQTALAHFDQLHPAGKAVPMVAINLSGASVGDPVLIDQVLDWIQFYGVDPARVCFEITETVAASSLAIVVDFMQRLRAAGCSVALDDFGAGMSSFTYLKHLPANVIKIDGSFVRDMRSDPVSRLMVRAVTDIGHQLGHQVIAEWVPNLETAAELAALGVNGLQGFALHAPELAPFQQQRDAP